MLTAIVANFNHGRFLDQALAALAGQSKPPDEIIIVDDASTDNSVAVIESWLPRLPNARLLRNETNLGVVRNMNLGIEIARGSEIVFVAADDIIYPMFFERLLALLSQYPDAAFAAGRTDVIDADGKRMGALNAPTPLKQAGYIHAGMAAALLMHDEAWFTGNAIVFRRAPVLAVGGFPEELAAFTDGYVCRLLAVKYGSCYTPEVLIAWRRMEGSFSWTCTEDIVRAGKLAVRAEALMRENGALFAAGYPERWKRRYLFGARRLALTSARRKARSKSPFHFSLALAREVAGTAWLFATLRPHDIFTVLRRRLARR
jgi:GT2 family glycosyltransferase